MPPINLSTAEINKIYLGDQEIEKIYLGNDLLYQANEEAFLLDAYPAPFAYSLKQLSTVTGNSLRLRREYSVTPEQDFTPTQLNNGTLLDFIPEKLDGNGFSFSGEGNRRKVRIPDEPSLQITGDLTIIIYLRLFNWELGSQVLVRKYGSSGNRGYQVRITSGRRLSFLWSEDGSSQLSSTSGVDTPVLDGNGIWIKVDFDADNGSGGSTTTFSTSEDGIIFTQLDQVINSGTTSIFASTNQLEILENMRSDGDLYRVIIKDGIEGTTVFDADFASRGVGTGEFTESTGKVVSFDFLEVFVTTIYNQGSVGSSGDLTQAIANYQPKIYDSNLGLVTKNGELGILFFDSNDRFSTSSFDPLVLFPDNAQLYIVYSPSDTIFCLFDDNNGANSFWNIGGNSDLGLFINPRIENTPAMRDQGQSLTVIEASSLGAYSIFDNGVLIGYHTGQLYNVGDAFMLGSGFTGNNKNFQGLFQEAIVFNSNNAAIRTSISNKINATYNIY